MQTGRETLRKHVAVEAGPVEISDDMLDLVAGGGGHWDPNGALPDFDPNGVHPSFDPDG